MSKINPSDEYDISKEDQLWIEAFEKEDKYDVTISKKHKIKMNRIFRKISGCITIPYPEVDNIYERIRSKATGIISNFFKG